MLYEKNSRFSFSLRDIDQQAHRRVNLRFIESGFDRIAIMVHVNWCQVSIFFSFSFFLSFFTLFFIAGELIN
jgi:hypothetical protein